MADENKKMTDEKKMTDGENKKVTEDKPKIAVAVKKKIAVVNGMGLRISTKQSVDICNMIRGKKVDNAIELLEEVVNYKRVVKMNTREVGHKKGKGVMAGRYPVTAAKEFIRLLKQLRANALVNEIEYENLVIFCKANKASRPYRRSGTQAKRTHVTLMLEEKKNKKTKKKSKKNKNKSGGPKVLA